MKPSYMATFVREHSFCVTQVGVEVCPFNRKKYITTLLVRKKLGNLYNKITDSAFSESTIL